MWSGCVCGGGGGVIGVGRDEMGGVGKERWTEKEERGLERMMVIGGGYTNERSYSECTARSRRSPRANSYELSDFVWRLCILSTCHLCIKILLLTLFFKLFS